MLFYDDLLLFPSVPNGSDWSMGTNPKSSSISNPDVLFLISHAYKIHLLCPFLTLRTVSHICIIDFNIQVYMPDVQEQLPGALPDSVLPVIKMFFLLTDISAFSKTHHLISVKIAISIIINILYAWLITELCISKPPFNIPVKRSSHSASTNIVISSSCW